jgi:hypothetical protein
MPTPSLVALDRADQLDAIISLLEDIRDILTERNALL